MIDNKIVSNLRITSFDKSRWPLRTAALQWKQTRNLPASPLPVFRRQSLCSIPVQHTQYREQGPGLVFFGWGTDRYTNSMSLGSKLAILSMDSHLGWAAGESRHRGDLSQHGSGAYHWDSDKDSNGQPLANCLICYLIGSEDSGIVPHSWRSVLAICWLRGLARWEYRISYRSTSAGILSSTLWSSVDCFFCLGRVWFRRSRLQVGSICCIESCQQSTK